MLEVSSRYRWIDLTRYSLSRLRRLSLDVRKSSQVNKTIVNTSLIALGTGDALQSLDEECVEWVPAAETEGVKWG
jgi:hypothetical protein